MPFSVTWHSLVEKQRRGGKNPGILRIRPQRSNRAPIKWSEKSTLGQEPTSSSIFFLLFIVSGKIGSGRNIVDLLTKTKEVYCSFYFSLIRFILQCLSFHLEFWRGSLKWFNATPLFHGLTNDRSEWWDNLFKNTVTSGQNWDQKPDLYPRLPLLPKWKVI